jgi:invasion protein IalB
MHLTMGLPAIRGGLWDNRNWRARTALPAPLISATMLLFYTFLTVAPGHGPQQGLWAGGVIRRIARRGAAFQSFEAIMGSFGPLARSPRQFRRAARLRLGVAVAAGLALLGLAGSIDQAAAQGAVRSVHADWQIRCDTPPGSQGEQCALIQSVTAEDRANVGLTVIVLKTADQKSRLMRVVAPMGVLLPSGLGLKIDQVDVGRAGFVRCLPNGCVAEVVMDETLVKQLRTGTTATFIIFQTPEEGIGFPMSLKGFGEGFDKLP